MARLLQQDLFVARHQTLLWVVCGTVFLVCAFVRLDTDMELPVIAGIGIAYAFVAAVYFSDFGASGRLDSQIIAGNPRPQIWLSTWLTLWGCFLLILVCALAGNAAAGLLRSGLSDSLSGWLLCILGFVLNAAAFAGVYALLGFAAAGRRAGRGTLILILLITVYLVFAIWGSYIDNALAEPETVPVYDLPPGTEIAVYDMDSLYVVDEVPNPDYIAEPQRSTLESLSRFLPVTQSFWLPPFLYDELTGENAGILLEAYLYSTILGAAGAALGMLVFRRRELD